MTLSRRRARRTGGIVLAADVARAAGVSLSTVSRVLNSPDLVNTRVLAKVQAVIQRLGYVPHGAAQALASRRFNAMGAIVPTLDNAIFARYIEGVQRRLNDHHYALLIACSDFDLQRELDEIRVLARKGVDGVMLVGLEHDPKTIEFLTSKQIPFVATWAYSDRQQHIPCVGIDNYEIGVQQVSFLADLGHTRFAVISGISRDNDRVTERVHGIRDSLTTKGLALPPSMIIEVPFSVSEARAAMHQLIVQTPRPTAVICINDVLAFGAIIECMSMNLSVPNDVSVIGVDDLEFSRHMNPPLTTVRVPSREMGIRAADYLVATLSDKSISGSVRLQADLIVRSSTGRPPDQRTTPSTATEQGAQP